MGIFDSMYVIYGHVRKMTGRKLRVNKSKTSFESPIEILEKLSRGQAKSGALQKTQVERCCKAFALHFNCSYQPSHRKRSWFSAPHILLTADAFETAFSLPFGCENCFAQGMQVKTKRRWAKNEL